MKMNDENVDPQELEPDKFKTFRAAEKLAAEEARDCLVQALNKIITMLQSVDLSSSLRSTVVNFEGNVVDKAEVDSQDRPDTIDPASFLSGVLFMLWKGTMNHPRARVEAFTMSVGVGLRMIGQHVGVSPEIMIRALAAGIANTSLD